MTTRFTKLANPLLNHRGTTTSDAPARKHKLDGREIQIGEPVLASGEWLCNTDVVFPVIWIEGLGDISKEGRFVCRHQLHDNGMAK